MKMFLPRGDPDGTPTESRIRFGGESLGSVFVINELSYPDATPK